MSKFNHEKEFIYFPKKTTIFGIILLWRLIFKFGVRSLQSLHVFKGLYQGKKITIRVFGNPNSFLDAPADQQGFIQVEWENGFIETLLVKRGDIKNITIGS